MSWFFQEYDFLFLNVALSGAGTSVGSIVVPHHSGDQLNLVTFGTWVGTYSIAVTVEVSSSPTFASDVVVLDSFTISNVTTFSSRVVTPPVTRPYARATLVRTGAGSVSGFTVQVGHRLPFWWSGVRWAERAGIFEAGDPVTATLIQPFGGAPAASTWRVRNMAGDTVATGAVSGAALTVTPPSGETSWPCGWYLIDLSGPTNDAFWSTRYGVSMFTVIRADARFPPNPAMPSPNFFGSAGDQPNAGADEYIRGITAIGPQRWAIDDARDPNGGTEKLTGVIANLQLAGQLYLNPAYADPARPREDLVLFEDKLSGTAWTNGVTACVEAIYPLCRNFEGPANEPGTGPGAVDGTVTAARMAAFNAAAKAADAGARTLGPNPVTYNHGTGTWMQAFIAAGGLSSVDALSVHAYNATNGDHILMRRSFDALAFRLSAAGRQFRDPDASGYIELWQTEQGFAPAEYGMAEPVHQAHYAMLWWLVAEQNGLPKERNHWWYISSGGFWDFPHFIRTSTFEPAHEGNYACTPVVGLFRTASMEVFGKVHTDQYDFGDPGEEILVGSLFEEPGGGDAVAVLVNGGAGWHCPLTVRVTGAATVEVVDSWGNVTVETVVDGGLVLDVPNTPIYVRLPDGVTLEVVPLDYGPNLALRGYAPVMVGYDGSTAAVQEQQIIRELPSNPYIYDFSSAPNGDPEAPFQGDYAVGDGVVELSWPHPTSFDRLVVFAFPLWQSYSTLVDFTVETLDDDGVTWTERLAVVEPTPHTTLKSPSTMLASWTEQFHSGRWIFDLDLGAVVTTRKVRLVVNDVTWGGAPTQAGFDDGGVGQHSGQGRERQLTLRGVRVYNVANLTPRYVFAG